MPVTAFDRLDDYLSDLARAIDVARVGELLAAQIAQLGFERFACSLISSAAKPREPFFLTNYPVEWRDHYDQQGLSRHDPIFAHALRSTEPMLWRDSRRRYRIETADRMVFGPSAEFGLSEGGGLGAYGAAGQVANLQVACDCSAVEFQRLFTLRRHELKLVTLYTHDRLLALIGESELVDATLTSRQREVLLWAKQGKTNWEIGEILHIAEDTVRQHVIGACRQLGATNRTHAVALAISRKIIAS